MYNRSLMKIDQNSAIEKQADCEHFLTDANMSSDLKNVILSYLPLNDLMKITSLVKNNLNYGQLAPLVEKTIDKNLTVDFHDLIHNLLDSKYIPAKDNHEANCIDFIEKILSDQRQKFVESHFELVERVFAHISKRYANNSGSQALAEAVTLPLKKHDVELSQLFLMFGAYTILIASHPENIFLLMKVIHDETIFPLVEQVENQNESLNITQCIQYFDISEWDTLIINSGRVYTALALVIYAASANSPTILDYLLNKQPDSLIEALNYFRRMVNSDHKNFDIIRIADNDINISGPYSRLLLKLKSTVHEDFILTNNEKRMLEQYMIGEIGYLNTHAELNNYWAKHKDAISLNQHRHTTFNTLFGGKNSPTSIKKNVLLALENRLNQIRSDLPKP